MARLRTICDWLARPAGPAPWGGDALAWAAAWCVAGVFLWHGWAPAARVHPAWPALLAALALAAWWRTDNAARAVAGALAALLAGLALAGMQVWLARTPLLPAHIGHTELSARVEQAGLHRPGMARLILRVRHIERVKRRYWPERVRVDVRLPRKGGHERILANLRALPLPGDEVRLNLRLLRLPQPAEPGAYDPARDLYFAGIGAVGRARLKHLTIIDATCAECGPWRRLARMLEQARRHVIARILQRIENPQGAALAAALLTGNRGLLDFEVREQLRAAGLAHILAISGLHLALVAGMAFWLARAVLALFPALATRHDIRRAAIVIALVTAFAYLLLSGNSVATRRAFIMLAVAGIAALAGRPAISMRNLAIAALVIVLFSPHLALSPGFQLSFMAVMGLVGAYEFWTWRKLHKARAREEEEYAEYAGPPAVWKKPLLILGGVLASTIIATFFTVLPAAAHFNRLSAWGLLGYMAALPVLTFAVMPAGLAAMLLPAPLDAPFLWLMDQGLRLIVRASAWVAALPGAFRALPVLAPQAAALMAAGLIWLALRRDNWRWLGVALVLAGMVQPFAPRPDVLVEERARLAAARNGQGLLAATAGRAGDFHLRIWLRRDGDPATPKQARKRPGWSCAGLVCRAHVKGWRVVYLREPRRKRGESWKDYRRRKLAALEAMQPACARGRADVVIAAFPLRGLCAQAGVRIDRFDVWRAGAHALFLPMKQELAKETGIDVRTSAGMLAGRPWAFAPLPRAEVLTRTESKQ